MFTFSLKDLLYHRGQTLFNILGLGLVIFSYLILIALTETMDGLVEGNGIDRNLIVIQADAIEPGDSNIPPQVMQAALELSPEQASRVSPAIFRNIRINGRMVQLRATPLEDWEAVHHLNLIEGRWPVEAGQVAIGEGAGLASGWSAGTVLRIYGRDFIVTGIFTSPGPLFASVWMPLETAQELFAPRRTSQMLIVQVAPGVDVEAVRAQLEQDPRLSGRYAVLLEGSFTGRYTQAVRDIALLLRVVAMLALLAVAFGTYHLTSLSLEERSREAGVLRAIGFSQMDVRGFLCIRALLLGLLSYIVGLSASWVYALFQQTAAPLFIVGFPILYRLSMINITSALILLAILAALGSWLGSRRLLGEGISKYLQRS